MSASVNSSSPSESSAADLFLEPRTPRVDAHHHLWRYQPAEFSWIDDRMALLRRDFLSQNLGSERLTSSVEYTVAVQARESLDENSFLLRCAETDPAIIGVVGWVPLTSPNLPGILDHLATQPRLIGVREIAQGQPQGFFDNPSFNRGINELTSRDLSYDILIYQDQLAEATRFVDRHPEQTFILDHAAKPRIASNEFEPWAALMRELARRHNIFCKISGMVTEADWNSWTDDLLKPYLDLCVDAFGPQRLLAGSDWPVCLVASSYQRWWQVLESYFHSFTTNEQRAVFGENAIRAYKLSLPGQSK